MTFLQSDAGPSGAGLAGLRDRLPSRTDIELGWRAAIGRAEPPPPPAAVAILPAGGRLSLAGPDGVPLDGIEAPLEALASAGTVDVLLPRNEHLPLAFHLPNASLSELEEMIETELATGSPFPAEEALWLWEARQGDDGWLVEASVVLAEAVRPALDALATSGASLGAVRRAPGDGPSLVGRPAWALPAGEATATSRKVPPALRLPAAGLGLFCALACLALLTSEVGRGSLAERVADARSDAAALRADIARSQTLQTAADRSAFRSSLAVHAAAVLPDGTWLERLSVTEEEANLSGFSPSAAETSNLLAATTLLKGLEFGAPVTRDNTQGIERFRLDGSLPWR